MDEGSEALRAFPHNTALSLDALSLAPTFRGEMLAALTCGDAMPFTQTEQAKVVFIGLGHLHPTSGTLLEKHLLSHGKDSEADDGSKNLEEKSSWLETPKP